MNKRLALARLVVVFSLAAGVANASPVFNFIPIATVDPNAVTGFQNAGARWSQLYTDNVTINIQIGFSALGTGILGQAGSATAGVSYSNARAALINDQTTADDATAVASLQNVTALSFLTNNRAGAVITDNDGSPNNVVLDVNRANLKAMGLIAANDATVDASITFSSSFTWDFDPTDGISAGAFDFVGIATHEIGHALGFVSGVDVVDYYSGPNGPGRNADLNGGAAGIGTIDPFRVFSTLDLFRYSGAGVRNLAYGNTPYFSLDGGVSNLGLFSTGSYNGDGRQASHWKDNLGLGIMDPTAANGELLAISNLDAQALDVIGWNRVQAVPEPASLILLGTGLAGLIYHRKRTLNK